MNRCIGVEGKLCGNEVEKSKGNKMVYRCPSCKSQMAKVWHKKHRANWDKKDREQYSYKEEDGEIPFTIKSADRLIGLMLRMA